MANYAVYRIGPHTPPGWENFDGRWVDLDDMPYASSFWRAVEPPMASATAVPTGRYETREDGAAAEVYEIVPCALGLEETP